MVSRRGGRNRNEKADKEPGDKTKSEGTGGAEGWRRRGGRKIWSQRNREGKTADKKSEGCGSGPKGRGEEGMGPGEMRGYERKCIGTERGVFLFFIL